jgi:hypothetical protein
VTAAGVILDTSALIVYGTNDLQILPLDELLQELRDDTGGAPVISAVAHAEALQFHAGDETATQRLWVLTDTYGSVPLSPAASPAVDLVVAEASVTPGMAHSMALSAHRDWHLATYAASTLRRVGFEPRLILDLNEVFGVE